VAERTFHSSSVALVVSCNPTLEVTFCADIKGIGVYTCEEASWEAGGKSLNVVRILKILGIPALLVGFAGGHVGEYLKERLHSQAISFKFIAALPETRCSVVIVNHKGEPIIIRERGRSIEPGTCGDLLKTIESSIAGQNVSCVSVSGSLPVGAAEGLYVEICRIANRYAIPVFLDSSGNSLKRALCGSPYIVKSNQQELEELLERSLADTNSQITALYEIRSLGAQNVILTRGERGALALIENAIYNVRVPKIKPTNSTGAGDAFHAGLIWACYASGNWEERLAIATSIAVSSTSFMSSGWIGHNFREYISDVTVTKTIHEARCS